MRRTQRPPARPAASAPEPPPALGRRENPRNAGRRAPGQRTAPLPRASTRSACPRRSASANRWYRRRTVQPTRPECAGCRFPRHRAVRRLASKRLRAPFRRVPHERHLYGLRASALPACRQIQSLECAVLLNQISVLNVLWRYSPPVCREGQYEKHLSPENLTRCRFSQQRPDRPSHRFPVPTRHYFGLCGTASAHAPRVPPAVRPF